MATIPGKGGGRGAARKADLTLVSTGPTEVLSKLMQAIFWDCLPISEVVNVEVISLFQATATTMAFLCLHLRPLGGQRELKYGALRHVRSRP